MTSTLGKRKCSSPTTVADIYRDTKKEGWTALHSNIQGMFTKVDIGPENHALLSDCIADVTFETPIPEANYGEFTVVCFKNKRFDVSIGADKDGFADMFTFLKETMETEMEKMDTKKKITPAMNGAYLEFQTWTPEQQRLFQTMIAEWPVLDRVEDCP
jgi:hypothetical protein